MTSPCQNPGTTTIDRRSRLASSPSLLLACTALLFSLTGPVDAERSPTSLSGVGPDNESREGKGDGAAPVPIIFDTDMDTDCDDAGALAMLHALADRGEATILATVVSSRYPYSAPAVEAINRHYGRPDLPIGVPKGEGASTRRGSRYAKTIAGKHATHLKTNDDAPSATEVYRKVLAAQPDGSVVIVTVGYVTNLHDLLRTTADAHSELGGEELVRRKVKRWVCMGGRYPAERDPGKWGNFKPHPEAAVEAAKSWPGTIYFSGKGRKIQTGKLVRARAPETHPVRMAYDLYLGERSTRPSWDQVAVLFAVRPDASFWSVREQGYNHIFENGTNEWRDEPETPRQRLVEFPRSARGRVTRTIEELMAHGLPSGED